MTSPDRTAQAPKRRPHTYLYGRRVKKCCTVCGQRWRQRGTRRREFLRDGAWQKTAGPCPGLMSARVDPLSALGQRPGTPTSTFIDGYVAGMLGLATALGTLVLAFRKRA